MIFQGWVRFKAFPDKSWQHGRLNTRLEVDSQAFICPCCEAQIRVRSEIRVLGIVDSEGKTIQSFEADKPKEVSQTEDQRLLAICRENGVMKAFEEAVIQQTRKGSRPPADLERFFISFLRQAERRTVPQNLLEEFVREFPGKVEFWQAIGLVMVVSSGRICRFISQTAMNVREDKSEKPQVYGVVIKNGATVWGDMTRVKHGYVPPSSNLFRHALKDHLGAQSRSPRPASVSTPPSVTNGVPGRLVRRS